MMADVLINWRSPLEIVPTLNRFYLVADGESSLPYILSGANLLARRENIFRVAELPTAPTCEEGEDGLH
ncbi:hypothetical protein [Bombella pollinis]|uniref:Uncharacterized protein n=1 Tax=Bombella pollinis TaxID=2967337 RepID=A0ABT3WLV4_9PROT|nr:hypothetical protein [Bombella pollinis]MCX5620112.1 hypothetical protein [Bombella pollinis]